MNDVLRDFRQRIIIDADNPILAMKANRDRYTQLPNQKKYAGMPYLGSCNSEDALTWNVFRSLQKFKKLNIVTEWLSLDIGEPTALLLWSLAPELLGNTGDLQYRLGDLIRSTDGTLSGQISEPDVVLQGTKGVAIIECKLGDPYKALSHLWEGRDVRRIKTRFDCYLQNVPSLLKYEVTEHNVESRYIHIYQLVRMSYFAVMLGQTYQIPSFVVSVGNNTNWSINIHKRNKSACDLWKDFLDCLGNIELKCNSTYWQSLLPIVKSEGLNSLYNYLYEHPCLK